MQQTRLFIPKLCCPTEEGLIRHRLRTVDGVRDLAFDLMQRELTVTHDLADEQPLLAALASLGLPGEVRRAPTGGQAPACGPACDRPPLVSRRDWVFLGVAGTMALAAEAVAWTTGREDAPVVVALAVGAMMLGGRETLLKGWRALRALTLDINFLMTIAIIGAGLIGQWPEAAMVTVLFALAEIIEVYSLDRARGAIRALMELSPETATVQTPSGDWRVVPVADVAVGQRVRVRPGERVPLDGTVVAGESAVNQAPITGESMPVTKHVGDPVFAGTINHNGALEVEVTANAGHSTLARIVRAVQQAQADKAPAQRFVDRFARYYTPSVVGLAVLVAILPPLTMQTPWFPWLYRALVLLVIGCPCALVISTPVTLVSGLAAAARHGVLIKGGAYLEAGRHLALVALDKTGTLTRGEPAVTDVVVLAPEQNETEVLRLAASLEALSEHPLAAAIVERWRENSSDALLPVSEFTAITGRGVRGRIEGALHQVGNHHLAHDSGVGTREVEQVLERLEAAGKTAVLLSDERRALAAFGVADTIRDTSVQAVRELHGLGLRTAMLTGDNQRTADAIAAQVGIDDARGNLLPEDKLSTIDELQARHGAVGMVGDGINDAPALARASIGFAMGAAGTDAALETADVALMEDDLRKLPEFVRLSRRTMRVLTQNITLALGIKAVFFVLAVGGQATLWMAVFADMGASLLVVFNGLRLLGHRGTGDADRGRGRQQSRGAVQGA